MKVSIGIVFAAFCGIVLSCSAHATDRQKGAVSKESWAAIAAFAKSDAHGGSVSIGYSRRIGTRSQVEMAAKNQCAANLQGEGRCIVVATWQSGCRYAAIGHPRVREAPLGASLHGTYVIANARSVVEELCDEKRLNCRKPVGGCL